MNKPLVNQAYLLERFDGKGGWTYIIIPEITKEHRAAHGLVRVKGSIDEVEIRQVNLFPLSDGGMMLPVKAAIRKQIRKEAGAYVHLTLYPDRSPVDIPEELQLCFADAPRAHQVFRSFTPTDQKAYIDWIYSAKKEETRIARIARTLARLEQGLRLYDKF